MATEVIRVVDPDSGSGYHYASLADWEADLGDTTTGNLPSDDQIAVAKCRCTGGTADTSGGAYVEITGWTTDSSHYIKVWTDPAESYRHSGTYPTGNKYRLESEYTILSIAEDYTKIIGIPIRSTAVAQSYRHGVDVYADGCLIDTCIIRGQGKSQSSCYGLHDNADTSTKTVIIINTIIYDWYYGTWWYNGSTANLFNCTFVDCTEAVNETGTSTVNCTNVGCAECTTAFSAGVSQTTCSSTTPTFAGYSSDNFHLAAGDTTWKGQGTNSYNNATYPFQTDIDGQDRGGSGAEWDIGADEYIAGTKYFRLRFTIDAVDDPASKSYQIEHRYKPSGGSFGSWGKTPIGE